MKTVELILLVIILVGCSAVCSGLNVALMSLNLSDLRRKAKLGNDEAKRVLPFRQNTHLTLAAILLTNVAAVSATSLVLGSVLYGLYAGIIATLLTVIFGEIMPQALFSRKALWYCAVLAPLMRLMIIATFVIAKPLQLLLDTLFPRPTRRQLASRQELGLMISEHFGRRESELDDDEIVIIRGALQLSEKRVSEILTPLKEVYWLRPGTRLSEKRIDEIKRVGYSRIPIFDDKLTKCYGVLLMKDLVDVGAGDASLTVMDMPLRQGDSLGERVALDTAFRTFMSAGSHLLPVHRGKHIIGIATMEDLIEEILGHEIVDETDKSKNRV